MTDPAVAMWTEALRDQKCVGYGSRARGKMWVTTQGEANVLWPMVALILVCMIETVVVVVLLTGRPFL